MADALIAILIDHCESRRAVNNVNNEDNRRHWSVSESQAAYSVRMAKAIPHLEAALEAITPLVARDAL